jgi:hypothetical protein
MSGAALVCPGCATTHAADERLCPVCGLPLVPAGGGETDVTPAQARARKVKPSYAKGDLVRVVTAQNQVEAEFVQSLLLEEGIPSTLRRTAGFDVPEMLAAGPRDVMVPLSALHAAREMLLEVDMLSTAERADSPLRLALWLVVAGAVGGAVIWAAMELVA